MESPHWPILESKTSCREHQCRGCRIHTLSSGRGKEPECSARHTRTQCRGAGSRLRGLGVSAASDSRRRGQRARA